MEYINKILIILYSFLPIVLVLGVITILWCILWHLALKHNPIIIDFFDLNKVTCPNRIIKKKKID